MFLNISTETGLVIMLRFVSDIIAKMNKMKEQGEAPPDSDEEG